MDRIQDIATALAASVGQCAPERLEGLSLREIFDCVQEYDPKLYADFDQLAPMYQEQAVNYLRVILDLK